MHVGQRRMCKIVQARDGVPHTVDGDGHAFGQDISIFALEGRNLSQWVDFQIVGRGIRARLVLDELKLNIIGLCDGENWNSAGMIL